MVLDIATLSSWLFGLRINSSRWKRLSCNELQRSMNLFKSERGGSANGKDSVNIGIGNIPIYTGGDLGGLGNAPPPKKKLRWGTAHASIPPIFREVGFVGCVWKHEQSKKRCHQGIIFWNRGFSFEERVMYTSLQAAKIWKILKKIGKIRKS